MLHDKFKLYILTVFINNVFEKFNLFEEAIIRPYVIFIVNCYNIYCKHTKSLLNQRDVIKI